MSNNVEHIFEECLERVFQGESIESCLTSYPNEAAYLEPLLRTAVGVTNRAAKLRPDPEFKARARMQLDSAWYNAMQPRPMAKPGRGFAWQRSLAFALTAVVLLVFSSVGTAFASSEALPDQPLYPAKLATEQVQLALTFSEENKVALHAQLAEKRAQEIAAMTRAGKTDYVVATATRLAHQMEQAEFSSTALAQKEAAQRASVAVSFQPTRPAPAMMAPPPAPSQEAAPSDAPQPGGEKTTPPPATDVAAARFRKAERARELVTNSTAKNIVVLEGVLEQAPPAAKPALNQVINRAREMQQRTLQQGITDTKPESQDGKPPRYQQDIKPDKPRPTSDQPEPLPPKPPVEPLKPRETPKPPLPIDTPKPLPIPIRPSGTTNTPPGILPTPVVPPPTGTTQPSGITGTQPGGSSGRVSPSGTSGGKR
jgi:hypothetical protein